MKNKERKTIFLDRDGVVNKEKNYLYKIEDFEFEEYVLEDLNFLQKKGYQIIIITNQSGIARGYYKVKDYKKLTKFYLNLLKNFGIKDVKVLYCPHHPCGVVRRYSKTCKCRKPQIQLFEKAIKKYKVDINNSIAVGDNIRDLAVTRKYPNIKGFLFKKEVNGFKTINRLREVVE